MSTFLIDGGGGGYARREGPTMADAVDDYIREFAVELDLDSPVNVQVQDETGAEFMLSVVWKVTMSVEVGEPRRLT